MKLPNIEDLKYGLLFGLAVFLVVTAWEIQQGPLPVQRKDMFSFIGFVAVAAGAIWYGGNKVNAAVNNTRFTPIQDWISKR